MVANWVVQAWEKVPEELCRKSWTHCGYKAQSELGRGGEIVHYTENETSLMVQRIIGDDAFTGLDDEEITCAVDPMEFDGYADDKDDEDDKEDDEEGRAVGPEYFV